MVTLPIMCFSPMVMMNSSSPFISWMMMELMTISFISTLLMDPETNWSAPLMYFIIQAISSSMLLLSITLSKMPSSEAVSTFMMLTLCMKIGISPFHLWLPWVMSKMSWMSCFNLMTLQKIIPFMFLLDYGQSTPNMLMWASILSSSVSVMALATPSIKKIFAYSSVSHSGWVLMILQNSNTFSTYFMLYTLINYTAINILMKYNMNFLSDMHRASSTLPAPTKLLITMLFMSLGGLPPLTGFIIKWTALMELSESSFLLMWIVLTSAINLYFYMRVTLPLCFTQSMMNKPILKTHDSKKLLPVFMILSIILMPPMWFA